LGRYMKGSFKAQTSKKIVSPTGFAKRISMKPIRSVISVGLLTLVVVSLGIYSLNKLFNPAPLTLAMVTTLSGGPQASQGQEALNGAQLYIDTVNEAGGVNGHPLKLQVFDDKFNANQAGVVARQVIASPALLLLGPAYSAMALPVNKIYGDAHIPLITASVSSDALTQNNFSAFRLRTLTSSQGNTSAIYVNKILSMNTASIVYADESAYGQPIANAFESTFTGHIAHKLPLNDQSSHNLNSIVTTLTNDPNRGIVFLAMTDVKKAGQVIVALRSKDPTIQILCTDAIDSDLLPASLTNNFTDGVYASAPVIYDSAPNEAQAFATQYQQKYGSAFGWFGAKYYEAAQVAVAALRKATMQGTQASLSNDRAQILNQLLTMDSPQASVEGLDGPLYFDNNHNGASPIRFGRFLQGRLRSLPTQLMEVSESDRVNLLNNKCTGEIIQVGNQCFWKQRVVYAGIDLNKVSSIDVTTSTFSADFYLWMRYNGADDVTAITFNDASNVSFDSAKPLASKIINGLQYHLYHVTGNFKATYDFHQYPFDQQQLNISFQNTRLTSEHLVYVIDALGLKLHLNNTAETERVKPAFQSLSSWMYQGTQYASDTFTSRSTLGDPRLFDQRTRTDYSGLQMTLTVQRKTLAYLVSHLLPLALLFLLVYASLHLPLKHLGDRLTLTVTALLASAVLLLSVNSELPEIGYAVSLDYIYYVFFALCLVCIVASIWLYERKLTAATRWINRGLHTTYVATVIITIICYLAIYSNRFV